MSTTLPSNIKCALVTGASSGLGQAIAVELGKKGYALILTARNERRLRDTLDLLSANARMKAIAFPADLSNPEEVSTLVERALEKSPCDRISLLVNNAGYAVTGAVEDISLEAIETSWRVNLMAAVSLTQQVLPQMKAQGQGTIVNISSGVARRALPFYSPYCMAKAAMDSFSESLFVETQSTGVHVLLYSPGPIDSGFLAAKQHFGNSRLSEPKGAGRDPYALARILISAIEAKKRRVRLGTQAWLGHHLNVWMPKLVDRILSRKFRLERSNTP